jgi:competence ComEA-like helix-hairpin-helix protein
MRILSLAATGVTLTGIFVSEALAQSDAQLPEGKGKAVVQRMCGGACHEVDVVTTERLSKQGWTNTVDTMISRGATGTEEEIASVIDYLALHFGREKVPEAATRTKINVNTESAELLASDLALSLDQARAMVDYRQKEGKFRSWDDLKKVPHLDLRMIESKKDRLVY